MASAIAATIFADAQKVVVKTDEFLRKFGDKLKSAGINYSLEGVANKVKRGDSIRRKLIATAVMLIYKNQGSPNYSLDLVRSIYYVFF